MCSNYWTFFLAYSLTLHSSYIALILFDFWLKSRVKEEAQRSTQKVRMIFYVVGYKTMLSSSWFKKETSNQRSTGSGYFKTLKELLRFHERFDSFFLSNYFNFFKKIVIIEKHGYISKPIFFLITKVNKPKNCPGAVSNNHPTLVHTTNQKALSYKGPYTYRDWNCWKHIYQCWAVIKTRIPWVS